MKTDDAGSAPIERVVRPAAGVVLDSGGWPVLTGRGNEDVFIQHRTGQRVYGKDALDAAVAAERERWAADARLAAVVRARAEPDSDGWRIDIWINGVPASQTIDDALRANASMSG